MTFKINAQISDDQTGESWQLKGTVDDLRQTAAPGAAQISVPPPLISVPKQTIIDVSKPSLIQNMKLGADGVWASVEGWEPHCADLEWDLTGTTKYGDSFLIELDRQSSYVRIGKNIKILRLWKDFPNGRYPNIYIGQNTAGELELSIELEHGVAGTVDGITRFYIDLPFGDGNWHHEKYEFKYPSACGAQDGQFKITWDRKVYLDAKTVQMDSANAPGTFDYFCIQDACGDSGNPLAPGSFVNSKNLSIIKG